MIRKRPTFEPHAKAGVSAGSYDDYYSYIDVGGPLAFDGVYEAALYWPTETASRSGTAMRYSAAWLTACWKLT